MKAQQSIRNRLPGTITHLTPGGVVTEVIVETAAGDVACVITTHSAGEMKLAIGDKVMVLIKATNVSVQKDA